MITAVAYDDGKARTASIPILAIVTNKSSLTEHDLQ